MEPIFDLTECVCGGELSAETRAALRPIEDCTSDALGAVNDVASYVRERAHGDIHNLVTSIAVTNGIGEAEAVRETIAFANQRVADLERMLGEFSVRHAGLADDLVMRSFMENCATWVRGYYEWVLITDRFADA